MLTLTSVVCAVVGMLSYFIIQQITIWGLGERSGITDILRSNIYTPICMAVYIMLLREVPKDTDCFPTIVSMGIMFVLIALMAAIIKPLIVGESIDYLGFIGMCVISLIYVLIAYKFLYHDSTYEILRIAQSNSFEDLLQQSFFHYLYPA